MLETFTLLREKIKKHPEVTNSILNYTEVWRSAHYHQLSEIINNNLKNNPILDGERRFEIGNTLSAITLKRFFEQSISSTATNDLRFIKTLDKLSIFLNYQSFNDFISQNNVSNINGKDHSENKFTEFENIIIQSAHSEMEIIKKLPEIDYGNIFDFVHEDSPYIIRINNYVNNLSEKEMRLHGRPSNYELYNIRTISQTDDLVVIADSEFWNLNFIDFEESQRHYHILNDQHYFLKKINGKWKIWDNFNPNIWEFGNL